TPAFALARAPVEGTETEVAVRHERAHAQLGGQAHRLPIMAFCILDHEALRMGSDLTQQPGRPRLVASLLVLPVQLEGLAGEPRRFVHPAGEQVRLRQPGMQRRATTGVPSLHGFALLSRMLKLDRATIPAAPALCTGSP